MGCWQVEVQILPKPLPLLPTPADCSPGIRRPPAVYRLVPHRAAGRLVWLHRCAGPRLAHTCAIAIGTLLRCSMNTSAVVGIFTACIRGCQAGTRTVKPSCTSCCDACPCCTNSACISPADWRPARGASDCSNVCLMNSGCSMHIACGSHVSPVQHLPARAYRLAAHCGVTRELAWHLTWEVTLKMWCCSLEPIPGLGQLQLRFTHRLGQRPAGTPNDFLRLP